MYIVISRAKRTIPPTAYKTNLLSLILFLIILIKLIESLKSLLIPLFKK